MQRTSTQPHTRLICDDSLRRRLGASPEQISSSSTPNENTSALKVVFLYISTSGAVYASVPPTGWQGQIRTGEVRAQVREALHHALVA